MMGQRGNRGLVIGVVSLMVLCGCGLEEQSVTLRDLGMHGEEIAVRIAWRDDRVIVTGSVGFSEVPEVLIAENCRLGELKVLKQYPSVYWVASDGHVLGGVDFRTGRAWGGGGGKYKELPFVTVEAAAGEGAMVMFAKRINAAGRLPADYMKQIEEVEERKRDMRTFPRIQWE